MDKTKKLLKQRRCDKPNCEYQIEGWCQFNLGGQVGCNDQFVIDAEEVQSNYLTTVQCDCGEDCICFCGRCCRCGKRRMSRTRAIWSLFTRWTRTLLKTKRKGRAD